MDGTEIETGYVSEGMYGDRPEGTVRFTFDGYEYCGSGSRYRYRGWQEQGKCKDGKAVGEESRGSGRVYQIHEGGLYRGGINDGLKLDIGIHGEGFRIGCLLFGRRDSKGIPKVWLPFPLRGGWG